VVNNTFVNNDPAGGTFIQMGSGVATLALVQNNVLAGVMKDSAKSSA
jgi:hypothetical protein